MEKYNPEYSLGMAREYKNVFYETNQNKYLVDYSKIVPILHINKKKT